jgi:hypothetical protein
MPIVGSFAGASARAYGLGAGVQVGDFESIQTITVGTAVANIEFTSIPATYTHLQIRALTSDSYGTHAYNSGVLRFNSDTTTTNYYNHFIQGSGSSAASAATNANRGMYVDGGTPYFAATIMDILDYANTNKYKTVRTIGGVDTNGGGYVYLMSTLWKNTAAITSIVLEPEPTGGARNWTQYSSFALYGVKA